MEATQRIKLHLIFVNFLQFFVWGAWLITIANYWFETKGWGPGEFGAIFTTLGLSSLFMPTIVGYISDRFINAEKLFAFMHLCGAVAVFFLTKAENPNAFFWTMLVAMLFYMPTIALCNAVSYTILTKHNLDVVKDFPFIRVFGTVGFIVAMWITNLLGFKATEGQFYVSIGGSIILVIIAFILPACPPKAKRIDNSKILDDNEVDVSFWVALKQMLSSYKMILFLFFSMLLGAALQLTNMYGDLYISEFKNYPEYANSIVVKGSTLIMSISQISETLFILTIPFFLRKYGIKNVMLISMFAWVLRFGLLAYGNPSEGLWMIIVSCVVYGMAFDFFNISGSLFVEKTTNPKIRSSAQGVFMLMTNGVGAIIGSYGSGYIIKTYFVKADKSFDWQPIWLCFAGYALVVAVLFAILFKHKHDPKELGTIQH